MTPTLITLTGPTCSGKTTIYHELINHFGAHAIISTTTREPRIGEVEGREYYFISEEESRRLEATNQFAELSTFNGVRYGITWAEMDRFKGKGLGVIVLDPNGVKDYERLAPAGGFRLHRVFVRCDNATRVDRLKRRLARELEPAATREDIAQVSRLINTHVDRIVTTLTEELKWFEAGSWDQLVDGSGAHESKALAAQIISSLEAQMTQKDWVADIAAMHSKFGVNPIISALPPEKLRAFLKFRLNFLREELVEAFTAAGYAVKFEVAPGEPPRAEDAEHVVDALIDICVVAIGTLNAFEVDAHEAWRRVHAANMQKQPGIKASRPNELGLPDLIKPAGWVSPAHADNVGLLSKALKAV